MQTTLRGNLFPLLFNQCTKLIPKNPVATVCLLARDYSTALVLNPVVTPYYANNALTGMSLIFFISYSTFNRFFLILVRSGTRWHYLDLLILQITSSGLMIEPTSVKEDDLLAGDIKMACSIQELIDIVSFGKEKMKPQHVPIVFQRFSDFQEQQSRYN